MAVNIILPKEKSIKNIRKNTTHSFIVETKLCSKLSAFKIRTRGASQSQDKEYYLIKLFNSHFYNVTNGSTYKFSNKDNLMAENTSRPRKDYFEILKWEEVDVEMRINMGDSNDN